MEASSGRGSPMRISNKELAKFIWMHETGNGGKGDITPPHRLPLRLAYDLRDLRNDITKANRSVGRTSRSIQQAFVELERIRKGKE